MTQASRVLLSIRVKATPKRAFAAFTEEIAEWWKPNGLFEFRRSRAGVLSFETGPEGRLVETYTDGTVFVIGDVRVWDPPHRLVVGWRQESFSPEQNTELHVRFEELDEGTRVTVEHFGWDAIPQKSAARHGFPLAVFQRRFAEWWQEMLRALRDRSAPHP